MTPINSQGKLLLHPHSGIITVRESASDSVKNNILYFRKKRSKRKKQIYNMQISF